MDEPPSKYLKDFKGGDNDLANFSKGLDKVKREGWAVVHSGLVERIAAPSK